MTSFCVSAVDRRSLLAGSASALAAFTTLSGRRAIGAEAKRGGTMTICYPYETPALVALTSTAVYGSAKVTEGLLDYDNRMQPVPQLATQWEISADGLVYTFALRQHVKWHDGRDFSASDVVYSIETLKRVHPRGRSTFAQLKSAVADQDHRVVLTFEKPVPYLLKALSAWETPIVPRHLYENTAPATNPHNNAPVGTGPFKFKERVVGSHIIYERNDAYWDAPRPYLDRIIVKFVPDAGGRSVALESGAVDIVPRTAVELADVKRLRTLPNLVFEPRGYETNQNVLTLFFNLDHPQFRQLAVRQAVAHAINRQAVGRVVYYDLYTTFASPIGPKLSDFHDPSPTPYPFDVAAAEALLDKAGLRRGADGLRFKIVYDASPLIEQAGRFADFVRASLTRIGIGVEIRNQDVSTYIRRIYTDRDFEMSGMTFSNLIDPTVGVQRIYWSKNIVKGVPFSNGMNYRDARVDELLEGAAAEPDLAKRKALFREFQQIVMRDVPAIPLGAQDWATIHNRRVAGHSNRADGIESNLAEAYVVG